MATRKASGKIRARLNNGVVTVQMRLGHPMETGSRKDPVTGVRLPRHFIREVVCERNGERVLALDWGWGVAAKPYLSFQLKQGRAGDSIVVRWLDNEGETGSLQTRVK